MIWSNKVAQEDDTNELMDRNEKSI